MDNKNSTTGNSAREAFAKTPNQLLDELLRQIKTEKKIDDSGTV